MLPITLALDEVCLELPEGHDSLDREFVKASGNCEHSHGSGRHIEQKKLINPFC